MDNYGLWTRHEWDQQKKLERLPVCDCCGEHIQDETYNEVTGIKICDECLKGMVRNVEV